MYWSMAGFSVFQSSIMCCKAPWEGMIFWCGLYLLCYCPNQSATVLGYNLKCISNVTIQPLKITVHLHQTRTKCHGYASVTKNRLKSWWIDGLFPFWNKWKILNLFWQYRMSVGVRGKCILRWIWCLCTKKKKSNMDIFLEWTMYAVYLLMVSKSERKGMFLITMSRNTPLGLDSLSK